jgi:molybdopterin converting factor small subunit
MMKVKVKLFATLRNKAPRKLQIGEAFSLTVTDNCKIKDLLELLEITEEEAKIILVNHETVRDYNQSLKAEDEISIFPPVGGGY